MTTTTLTHAAERRGSESGFFRSLAERFYAARTLRMLESFDDRMLRDIGLTRGDLMTLRRR